MKGECKKCDNGVRIRGLKQITCKHCGYTCLVAIQNSSNICGFCSKELGLCLQCGEKLEKEEEK